MKLNYIIGRAHTGKSYELMKRIAEEIESPQTESIIFLVPEQYTLHGEYELINKMNLNGLLKVDVLSFKRLAHKIIGNNFHIEENIDDVGKYMIINKIINDNKERLKVFKNSSQKGILSEILSLINNFKNNSVYGLEIMEKIDGLKEGLFKSKLEDIGLIYGEFEEEMKRDYIDDSHILDLLRDQLENSHILENTRVYMDGFDSFSGQEYSIIEQVLLTAKSVDIALTLSDGDRDNDVFTGVRDTFHRLRDIANTYNIDTAVEKKIDVKFKDKALVHLEKEFYSYPYDRYEEDTDALKVLVGLNRNEEVESVARNIVNTVMEDNYRWRDILLVSNNMDIYQSALKRIFTEYGIPYFLDETRDITNNSLIIYLLSTLDSIIKNFRYDDVFKSLKTGFSNLSQGEIELLENYVLEYDIKGDGYFKPFVYGEDLERIEPIRAKYADSIGKLRDKIRKKTGVEEINRSIFEFLLDLDIKSKVDSLLDQQKYNKSFDKANETAQIWNILIEVLEQMNIILGQEKSTLREYKDNLESGIQNHQIGVVPPTLDQVMIGNLERSRSKDVKVVYMIGVNDGIIPSIVSDAGILTDQEKRDINEIGIDIRIDSDKKIQDEKFLIYSSISKPSHRLVLSYALSDNEGKSLRPSTIIERVKELYPDLEEEYHIEKKNDKSFITLPTPTIRYLTSGIRDYIETDIENEEIFELLAWYKDSHGYRDKIGHILDGLFYSNQKEYIESDRASSIYQRPIRSSISRIESFVRCPFSHFVNYGLNPSERKKCQIKTPDIGSLFHKSIENYSEELAKRNKEWDNIEKGESEKIVDTIIEEMVEDFQSGIFMKSSRYKYLVNKLKRVSKKAIWTATEHIKNGEFNPLKHELKFGTEDSDIPPLIIELEDGEQIILEGRIDRVDILKDGERTYVKVIDYKSGSKSFSLSEVFYGLQIQLVVYLEAILKSGKNFIKNEIYPAGALYFKIKDPMINTEDNDKDKIAEAITKELKMDGMVLKDIEVVKELDNNMDNGVQSNIIPAGLKKDGSFYSNSSVFELEEFKSIIWHVNKLISDIGAEILKGSVKVEPCKNGDILSCEYCEFGSICQFDLGLEDNVYRDIKKLNKNQVLEKIKGEAD